MRLHWIRVGSKTQIGVHLGEEGLQIHRDTQQAHREISHVKTEAETGVTLPQAKDSWESP